MVYPWNFRQPYTTMMKKQIRTTLLAVALLCAAFTQHAQAQDVDQELAAFSKQFEAAFNKEDHVTLQSFYTTDAIRVAKDGTSITGAEAIGAFLAEQFKGADLTLTLTQTLVSWSDANHAYITKGAYQAKGVNVQGAPMAFSGTYSNIMLKENGAWKISRSHLSE